jgi:NAD(P)-dependent dehydrogenase (short-subunit alcohol dehydrogenase family)
MSDSLFNLDGRVALVTGASRGIGEATAHLLARYGAHVIVSSRRHDSVAAVADGIRAAGGKASALACHVGEPSRSTRPSN